MIMIILVADGIRNTSVTPESNRGRTLYLNHSVLTDSVKKMTTTSAVVPYSIIKDYIQLLKTPVMISAYSGSHNYVNTEQSPENMYLEIKYTDTEYWKFLTISILKGRIYSKEEFLAGSKVAVISEKTAKQLFVGEEAIGQDINIDTVPYRVIGITKTISPIFNIAISDIWIPYTSKEERYFNVMLLYNNKSDIKAIKNELREIEKKFQYDNAGQTLFLRGPDTHRVKSMGIWGEDDERINNLTKIKNNKLWFVLVIFMLVPTINLSGLNMSRIKRRTPEIGVRKAFGAKKHIILIQMLCENLITSFTGGIIGLVFSIFTIFHMRERLLDIPPDSEIPFNAIITIPVILSVFTVCVIINVLSTAIPAYRASRMTIVSSITNNDKPS